MKFSFIMPLIFIMDYHKNKKIFCPNAETPLWNMHPRVFLDASYGEFAKCSYCGTEYYMGRQGNKKNYVTSEV